jgi:TetR/AcrR family transcriptional regulator, transcriptional repressor for nem operon
MIYIILIRQRETGASVGASQEDKARSHEAVVAAAASSVRANGLAATTVGQVMGAAGLTHGGFYAHFASRDHLLVAAVERAFAEGRATIEALVDRRRGRSRIASFVSNYLSKLHIDNPEVGCAAAALAVDVARAGAELSDSFERGIAEYLQALEADLGEGEHVDDDAALLLSALVGAVALGRAMGDGPNARAFPKQVEAALKRRVLPAEVP